MKLHFIRKNSIRIDCYLNRLFHLFCAVIDLTKSFFLLVCCNKRDGFESMVLLDWRGGLVVDVDDDDANMVSLLLLLVLNEVRGVLRLGKISSRANFSMSTSKPFILLLYSRSSDRFAIDDVLDDELFDSTL